MRIHMMKESGLRLSQVVALNNENNTPVSKGGFVSGPGVEVVVPDVHSVSGVESGPGAVKVYLPPVSPVPVSRVPVLPPVFSPIVGAPVLAPLAPLAGFPSLTVPVPFETLPFIRHCPPSLPVLNGPPPMPAHSFDINDSLSQHKHSNCLSTRKPKV